MGDQGAESIHSHVKKLEANYSGITNRLDRLKYIFNEYMLETAEPEASSKEKKNFIEICIMY